MIILFNNNLSICVPNLIFYKYKPAHLSSSYKQKRKKLKRERKIMGKLMAKRFCIGFGCGRIGTGNNKRSSSSSSSSSSFSSLSSSSSSSSSSCNNNNIKWEMRPGGMLVQKRSEDSNTEDLISLRVSTVSQLSYEISIDANSTFGNYVSSFNMKTKTNLRLFFIYILYS